MLRNRPERPILPASTPEKETKGIRPDYYQFHQYDVFDIAAYFGLAFPLGNALKYLLRAGKKDQDKDIEDLQKAMRCIQREIDIRRQDNVQGGGGSGR